MTDVAAFPASDAARTTFAPKRTCELCLVMSALGQEETHVPRQIRPIFLPAVRRVLPKASGQSLRDPEPDGMVVVQAKAHPISGKPEIGAGVA